MRVNNSPSLTNRNHYISAAPSSPMKPGFGDIESNFTTSHSPTQTSGIISFFVNRAESPFQPTQERARPETEREIQLNLKKCETLPMKVGDYVDAYPVELLRCDFIQLFN